MTFWSNPWIIGIGTAIISGLVVNLVSNVVGSARDRRKAQRKINAANTEVVSSLRTVLTENSLLDLDILSAVIRATAHKHRLDERVMMPIDVEPKLLDEYIRGYNKVNRRRFSTNISLIAASAVAVVLASFTTAHGIASGIYTVLFTELWQFFVLFTCGLIIWSHIHKWFDY